MAGNWGGKMEGQTESEISPRLLDREIDLALALVSIDQPQKKKTSS